MLLVYLWSCFVMTAMAQVSPRWGQSPYVQTGRFEAVPNQNYITGVYYYNVTYLKTVTTPKITLSLRQIRTAAQTFPYELESTTNQTSATSFQHKLTVGTNTEVYYLQVQYFVYDDAVSQLSPFFFSKEIKIPTETATPALPLVGTSNTNTDISVTGLSFAGTYRYGLFLSALKGDLSAGTNVFLQVNSTLQKSPTFKIRATISTQTTLQNIAYYLIVANVDSSTGLPTQEWVFVQDGFSSMWYGVQSTFWTPTQGYFQGNYISGLTSLSMIKNVQYNFTITGFNFYTFNDSMYNDISHFNLWVRNCDNPYVYFNKADRLCYAFCPIATYVFSVTHLICDTCNYKCASCTAAATCQSCGLNRAPPPTCNCQDIFYQLNQVCVACHYSCKTCSNTQFFNCLSCDSAMQRTLATVSGLGQICQCNTNYEDAGVTLCQPTCGDGVIVTGQACDDGGTASDDGCSSTCQVQSYFQCDNTPAPSKCFYIGNLTVSIFRIEKADLANEATFYLKVSPYVPLMAQLINSAHMVTNITSAAYKSVAFVDQMIVFTVTYAQSFHDVTVMFGIKPDSIATSPFTRFKAQNATFVALASNGLYLNAYPDYEYYYAAYMGNTSLIAGLVFLGISLLFCVGHLKQIGLELYMVIQFCFMSYVVFPRFSPEVEKMTNLRHVMGWNDIMGQKLPPYHKWPVTEQMGFSAFFQYNFNIMIIMPGLSLVLYVVYRLLLWRHQKRRLDALTSDQFSQTISGKIFGVFRFDMFVYWTLLSMQQILFSTTMQVQSSEQAGSIIYLVCCLIAVVVCLAGLVIRPKSMRAYRQQLFHRSYGNKTFLLFLVCILVMDLLLLLSVLVLQPIFYAVIALPVFMLIYTLARRPFRSVMNNIRFCILMCCLITVISLQFVGISMDNSTNNRLGIGVLICVTIAVATSFATLLEIGIKKILKMKNKDEEDDQSKYTSQKEEESINEKVREAGMALLYGNSNTPRVPTKMEMSNLRTDRSQTPMIPPAQQLRVAPRKSNVRQFKQSDYKKSDVKSGNRPNNSGYTVTVNKSNYRDKNIPDDYDEDNGQEELTQYKQSRNNGEDRDQGQPVRSNRRRLSYSPYQEILNQTATRYK